MWSFSAALVAACLVCCDRCADPLVSPKNFQRWFDASSAGRLQIPEEVEARAQAFRYVFVGGFYNNIKPGYFAQNIKELKAHGVPRRAIAEIYPSSRKTIAENRDLFRTELLKLAKAGPEKLVVIAHSRGACDALAFALENSAFTRDRVAFLFLVQGPLGGSPLADYVLGDGKRMDHKVPLRYRVFGYLTGKMEHALWKRGVHGGLSSLTLKESERFWDGLLDRNEDAIPVVCPRTFYVTSSVDPTELGVVQGSTGRYLDAYHGPNDGIVPLDCQTLPDLGTELGPLEVGHADLTQRFPASHAPRRYRKALIEAILMAVGQEKTEVAPDERGR